jgi:hypothetical protein
MFYITPGYALAGLCHTRLPWSLLNAKHISKRSSNDQLLFQIVHNIHGQTSVSLTENMCPTIWQSTSCRTIVLPDPNRP